MVQLVHAALGRTRMQCGGDEKRSGQSSCTPPLVVVYPGEDRGTGQDFRGGEQSRRHRDRYVIGFAAHPAQHLVWYRCGEQSSCQSQGGVHEASYSAVLRPTHHCIPVRSAAEPIDPERYVV
jgi:hypothetical protein